MILEFFYSRLMLKISTKSPSTVDHQLRLSKSCGGITEKKKIKQIVAHFWPFKTLEVASCKGKPKQHLLVHSLSFSVHACLLLFQRQHKNLGVLSFMNVLKLRTRERRTEKSIWYHSQHLFSVKETGTVLKYSCRITFSGTMHVSSFGYILAGLGPSSTLFLFSYIFLLSSIRRD